MGRGPGAGAAVRSVANLADAFEQSGLMQVELAAAAGCSKQFIGQLLKGDARGCSIAKAHAIEEALQVVAGSLFVRRDLIVNQVVLLSQESTGAAT